MHHLALHRGVASALVALAVVGAAACKGPSVDRDAGDLFDSGTTTPPPAPIIDSFDTPVPWPLATLRGRATDARRVLVMGGENPLASSILPDGTFCIDVPMPNPATYDFLIFAQSDSGVLSASGTAAQVVFDPGAAPVPGAVSCQGTDPAGCLGATEICDNGRDDDCNGLRDDLDPACVTCADDPLEPNDDIGAPRVDPGRYDGLRLCPGNDDWYGIYAREGDTLDVRVFFSHASGNIDVELFDVDGTTVLERGTSEDDDESVVHVVTTTGEHALHVYGLDGATTYTLDIDVTGS